MLSNMVVHVVYIKQRLFFFILIFAVLTSCGPGGSQTKLAPTPTVQPQIPNCKATATGFCWPIDKDLSNVTTNWLADSCPWSGNDDYQTETLPNGEVIGKYHIGWDISAITKTKDDPVIPVADGTVIWVSASRLGEDNAGWGIGNVGIFVKHKTKDGKEFIALYGHVRYEPKVRENVLLKDGAWDVKAGVPFAKLGPYPASNPHLHFGIIPTGTIPSTDGKNGIGWGKMWCPSVGPINKYNGFTNPYEWITTKTPLNGTTQVPVATFTPSVLGATAPPVSTSTPAPTFTTGDYFIYNLGGGRGETTRVEFTGIESFNGYNTWIFEITFDMNGGKNPAYQYAKEWVDQATGLSIKEQMRVIYSIPESFDFNGEQFKGYELNYTRFYNLNDNTERYEENAVDVEGIKHERSDSYPAGYYYFVFLPATVQIGDWYPWRTEYSSQQVVSEEIISVPAGNFNCWVIKQFERKSDRYYLRYYDKMTGISIKDEFWWLNQTGQREMMVLRTLESFHMSNVGNSIAQIDTNLLQLNRAEYFSVLQWIKYATLNNDISVFEELIVGNSIQLIDGNNKTATINKADFLAELSKRLLNKPNCDFFMFEESGRLVIRIDNWSPGWGVDGNTIVYLILEMKNNQWVLTSIIYGDHLPSWAQGLERINYDTISLSAGTTTGAVCQEARPTRLEIGDFAFVSFYPPLRQRVRSGPGTSNSILDVIPVGSAVKILDGPECADNWVWWKVRVLSSKLEGWTSEGDADAYWLIPCESREGCGTQ